MHRHLSKLWRDDAGFIVSAELVLLGTLLVVGLITGLSCVQEALIGEYQDVAGAIRSLDQSYAYSGMQGCVDPDCCVGSWTAGSAYGMRPVDGPVCFDGCLLEPGPCTTNPADVSPLPGPACLPYRIPDCHAHRAPAPSPCYGIKPQCEPAAAVIRSDAIPHPAACLDCSAGAECQPCERTCSTQLSDVTGYFIDAFVPSPPLFGPLVW